MSEDSQQRLQDHYRLLLGLSSPWEVASVDLRVEEREVLIEVEWPKGQKPPCPKCGERCDIHDRAPERRWRHLDTMQFETVIACRTPRVRCPEHGVLNVEVPWAEPRSRFTLLFEALAVEAISACRSLRQAQGLLGLSFDQLQRIMQRAVERGLRRRGEVPVSRVGVDEKAFRRGHGYLSAIADIDGRRVLEVCEGRDGRAAEALFESLGDAAAGVRAAAMDMWPAFMRAAATRAPQATVVHDRFHVSKHLNEAVDKVRKQESKELSARGDDWLKGTKYLFLRGQQSWTEDHREMFAMVKELNLKVAKAWAAKEAFAQFWEFRCPGKARAFFNNWRRWVGRLKIQPLTKVSDMLKRHLDGLLSYATYPISNAVSEGFNSKIQTLISNARGYRRFENLRTAVLFHCGRLDMCPLKTQ